MLLRRGRREEINAAREQGRLDSTQLVVGASVGCQGFRRMTALRRSDGGASLGRMQSPCRQRDLGHGPGRSRT